MLNKKHLNIPNLLSLYRILAFPLVLYFAFSGQEKLFAIFLVINLITDILDGLIARTFKLETDFGARLDSIADIGTYILAFTGVMIFKLHHFTPHLFSFCLFIGLFLGANLLAIIKFGRTASLHLYSSKIGGYIQGSFFFTLFVFDFYAGFYYFMITWGILSFCEHITIQLIIPELKSNLKGLYWVLKSRND